MGHGKRLHLSNSLRKPFTLSTNTLVSAFLPTVPLGSGGKNFTIASFEVHIFKVVSGGIFQEELYHVFWDYHRVP